MFKKREKGKEKNKRKTLTLLDIVNFSNAFTIIFCTFTRKKKEMIFDFLVSK